MTSRLLLILLPCICFGALAYTAAPPVHVAVDQPSGTPDSLEPTNNASALSRTPRPNGSITFKIPGTTTNLIFSKWSSLLSQTELNLCTIEALGAVFKTVVAKGRDGPLPLKSLDFTYGNVVINVHDFSAPAFRMTYGFVVAVLRGIALFTSMHGYYGMTFDVYDETEGHVGTGDFGPILPA